MANSFRILMIFLKPVGWTLFFLALAGAFNAAMDITFSHFDRSVFAKLDNPAYYNPQISWVNKWAVDASGKAIHGVERFWESSRMLVAFTDFWHLAKTLMIACIMLGVISYRRQQAALSVRCADFVLAYLAFTGTFTLFYDCILVI